MHEDTLKVEGQENGSPYVEMKENRKVSFLELMRIVWPFGFVLLGDTYVNVMALRKIFVVDHEMYPSY